MTQNWQPGTASNSLSSKVELVVSCKNLRNADTFSKSDPFVVMFTADDRGGWKEYGRTETIDDNLNPEFAKKFTINYRFESQQKLKFEVYDSDSSSSSLSDHDFLGRSFTTLGEIVGASSGSFTRNLRDSNNQVKDGLISINAEEVAHSRHHFNFRVNFTGLPSIGWMSPNPKVYMEIRRANESGNFDVIHRTEQQITRSPSYLVDISGQKLNNGDEYRNLKFQLYRWKATAMESVLWGEFEINGNEILEGGEKVKSIGNKSGSDISARLNQVKISETFSFLDHLRCGLELNFVVSIDFTGSNGNPASMDSLHYMDPHKPNQYSSAIINVGNVVQDYDTDKMFPVFGFGAKIPPNGQVSHMFPCNFQNQNPFVQGVNGILEVYRNCLPQIQLFGPTNFAPTIRECTRMTQSGGQGDGRSSYFVTLILTDGAITDMQQTIDAIVDASFSALSIIIIGVGNADFSAMDDLDCDDGLLRSSSGRTAQRDIVQFVPMNKFKNDPIRLAEEVLAEVPEQVQQWARFNNIKPNFDFQPVVHDPTAPPPYGF